MIATLLLTCDDSVAASRRESLSLSLRPRSGDHVANIIPSAWEIQTWKLLWLHNRNYDPSAIA